MKKKSKLKALRQYLPDKRVLDEELPFDNDISQPLFHKGNTVGCITLHGIGGTPANVRVLADALIERGYTVISPTLPGHGETVRALNESTGEQWLQCVLEAYDRLKGSGCTRIYALGLSLGGILSGLLATQRPLDGLALICAPIEMQPYLHMARRISWLLPFVRFEDDEETSSQWQQNPYSQMYNGFSTKKLVDLNRLCKTLRDNLDKIICPTLMINAKYDDKVAASSIDIWKARATNVPHCQYVYMQNSPHGCTYARERDLVAKICSDFVSGLVDKSTSAPI